LKSVGLADAEARAAAAEAEWGFQLIRGGAGVSRLGGAPVLATDTPWPYVDHRPLTHLATIAMAELPDIEGREYLPMNGLLSFFADLSEEGELMEDIAVEDGAPVAVIHTSGGVPTHELEPPDERLDELRVLAVPRLQLRRPSGAYQPKVDALALHALERVTERVNGPAGAQLLGHPRPVQEDPREPGQRVVFHISEAVGIGFAILDGGDLHFLGEADRWDQLTAIPDSC
jgi:hypothetical protein